MSEANQPPQSDNDESQEEQEEKTDFEKFGSKQLKWEESNEERYEVVSDGPGGFDRVVRPDYKSAKSAAEIHEKATGNFCKINKI